MDPKCEKRWHYVERATAGSEPRSACIWQRDKGLTYFYKLVNSFPDLDILNYVSFVSYGRTRNCVIPSLIFNTSPCRASSFQSSFFNRIVPLWNRVCKMVLQSDLQSLIMFKSFPSRTYSNLLVTFFDVDITCTWSLQRSCSCHKY